ncbi:hypothetical protein [Clostridium gasigenes]|uniref:hypothetical protein n=1 Tax=Clostridium gasigenes TaxID=94869 RepID=UPI001C0AFE78|nr:hypothetical protein [Clostridium gasigenes]MBU3106630.1 hypothetical protein [Clostridium gasigenes]
MINIFNKRPKEKTRRELQMDIIKNLDDMREVLRECKIELCRLQINSLHLDLATQIHDSLR